VITYSTNSLERPYGFCGISGAVSGTGTCVGWPYTVDDEEKMNFFTSNSFMTFFFFEEGENKERLVNQSVQHRKKRKQKETNTSRSVTVAPTLLS